MVLHEFDPGLEFEPRKTDLPGSAVGLLDKPPAVPLAAQRRPDRHLAQVQHIDPRRRDHARDWRRTNDPHLTGRARELVDGQTMHRRWRVDAIVHVRERISHEAEYERQIVPVA
jgi:hypothetical protein